MDVCGKPNARPISCNDCPGRKSLRLDGEGNPRLDKVVRLDAFFEGYEASEISTDLVRKFIVGEQAKGLANGSINRSLAGLKRMFNLAKQDGRLREVPYIPMLKESAPRQGFFERSDYNALLAVLPEYLKVPFSVAFFVGLRLEEVLGLRWEQVDFLANTIELRAGETKNGEGRVAPICAEMRTVLNEQRARRQADCPNVCFKLDRKGRAVQIKSFRKA